MTIRRLFAPAVLVCATFHPSQPALAQFATQGTKLIAADASGLQPQQGWSVSLSGDGNTAIIGGYQDNGFDGAAWVWTRVAGIWVQQGSKLTGSGATGSFGAEQGYSVSISADGQTAIVGGFGDAGGLGAAWIWTRNGGIWTQQGTKLVGSGAVGAANQGSSVSLSADGNTALVGGDRDNNDLGAFWVWTRSGGVWTQQGTKLVGSGSVGSMIYQGHSLSISADGNTAIVGGIGDNFFKGAAWIWTKSQGVWTQQGAKLVDSDPFLNEFQGYSVSISGDGNTAIVGAPFEFGGAGTTGAARIWTRNGEVWSQDGTELLGSDATGLGQGFAVALSSDGNTALVGSPFDFDGVGDIGAAWTWTRKAGIWTQSGPKLVGPGAVGYAQQGASVSLSGDGRTAIVGGPQDNAGVKAGIGAAWIFVAVADLTITKSHSGNFRQGDSGDTYAITVTNSGAASTSGTVSVTDTLPIGLTPTAPNGPSSGWSCSIAGQILTCTRSDALAPGASHPPITLTLNVANNAAPSLTNTATVSGGGEVNTTNDTASDATVIVQVADLSITKAVVGTPLFGAGANRTYMISAFNNGGGSASGVVVTDVLPAGSILVSSTPSQGSCSGTTTVTCSLGALASGGSATISLVLKTSSTPGVVINTATVSAVEFDPNTGNNSSTSTITTVDPSQLPVASEWALLILAGVLAMLGVFRTRA